MMTWGNVNSSSSNAKSWDEENKVKMKVLQSEYNKQALIVRSLTTACWNVIGQDIANSYISNLIKPAGFKLTQHYLLFE